jgi:hypothetical protein
MTRKRFFNPPPGEIPESVRGKTDDPGKKYGKCSCEISRPVLKVLQTNPFAASAAYEYSPL